MAKKLKDIARSQVVFWKKIAIMVDAGAPFFKCVETAVSSTEDADLQQAMNMWILENQGRDEFEGTTPLSDALDAFPSFFPPFIIAAVKIAEETKTRQNIYHELADYLEKEALYG